MDAVHQNVVYDTVSQVSDSMKATLVIRTSASIRLARRRLFRLSMTNQIQKQLPTANALRDCNIRKSTDDTKYIVTASVYFRHLVFTTVFSM